VRNRRAELARHRVVVGPKFLSTRLPDSPTYGSDPIAGGQKQVSIDEQLKKFEEELRHEMMVAEKYKYAERPQAPADALIQIGNSEIASENSGVHAAQENQNELVGLSGD